MREDTLPKFLLGNYHKYGSSQTALREKNLGIWQSYNWAEYFDIVRYLSLAFFSIGLKPGNRVSILGENKPHAYWFELAAQSAGGIVVGIFADCTPPEIEYYLSHSDSRFVVCQDQEQVDKVLEINNSIPELQKIIYWDPKGLWTYKSPLLMSMDQMMEIGKSFEKEHPNLFEELVASTKGEDLAVFFYSSGTTGQPKAAMVTYNALLSMARSINSVDQYKEDEQYLSFLPIAWIAEQLFGVACSLFYCLQTNFPEEPETVQENIREIGPKIVFFGPRLWENMIGTIQVKILDSSWLHRLFYYSALKIGYRMADLDMRGHKAGLFISLLYILANLFVFRPLRDNLGLAKTRIAYSAGSAVSPDVIRYFHAIGVNLKQIYGSSEVGIIAIHRDHDIKPETCGPPLPGVELKLSAEGEIIVRTASMFSGYHKEQEKDAKRIKDGWYYTGDFGYLDKDGHLIVMDRMEDLMELADGHKFSPQYCETRLRFSPYLKDALVVARENEAFIGVIVNIDFPNVSQWAESQRIPYTTFADLSQKPQVIELIRKELVNVNKTLPEYSRIRKFINLHKEFDPDEAEMTRTRKLRRTFVEERFKELIDAIFSGKESLEVISQIIYQDGRTGTTRSLITVNNL